MKEVGAKVDENIQKQKNADEAFISNSIIGIQSVSLIENHQLPNRFMTDKIKAAFESETQDIKSWTCI